MLFIDVYFSSMFMFYFILSVQMKGIPRFGPRKWILIWTRYIRNHDVWGHGYEQGMGFHVHLATHFIGMYHAPMVVDIL